MLRTAKGLIPLDQIKSYRHGVSEKNNRQYLELELKNGKRVPCFDATAFVPSSAAKDLHLNNINAICPNCGELNNDNWPLRHGGVDLWGGCVECWEAVSYEK